MKLMVLSARTIAAIIAMDGDNGCILISSKCFL